MRLCIIDTINSNQYAHTNTVISDLFQKKGFGRKKQQIGPCNEIRYRILSAGCMLVTVVCSLLKNSFYNLYQYSAANFQTNKQEKNHSCEISVFIFGILFKGILEQAFPKLILINRWLRGDSSSGMYAYFLLKIRFI